MHLTIFGACQSPDVICVMGSKVVEHRCDLGKNQVLPSGETRVLIIGMNRSELISRIARLNPQLQAKDAELGVKVIIEALSNTLSKGGRVEIRGFGSFALNYKPPRLGRNPKTGDKVDVPAKYVPHFKTGKELRECVIKLHVPNT